MKHFFILIMLICCTDILVAQERLSSMPKAKRDSILVELTQKVLKEKHPQWYREKGNECHHLENDHFKSYKSMEFNDDLYSRIPPQLKKEFDEMVIWRVSQSYPDATGSNREKQILWETEDFTLIYDLVDSEKYQNEIDTYNEEIRTIGGVSKYYDIERRYMLWKYQELLRLSKIYYNH